MSNKDFLYHQVAEKVERLIENEVFKVGDRLPSVRKFCKDQKISLSTAYQAYYFLEAKGLIEARPQSGYYVKLHPVKKHELPQSQAPEANLSNGTGTISELIAEVYKDLNAENQLMLSVSSPDPSLLPVAKLKKSMLYALKDNAGVKYENIMGNKKLRQQLAKLGLNWGGSTDISEIIVTAGCMEALVIALKVITKPGDQIVVESPTYFGVLQTISSLGLESLEVRTDPSEGVDIAHLRELIGENNRIKACLFVPNFNSPLGCVMPDNRKQELVELLEQKQVTLIEDDIYGELYFGKFRPRTCKSFDEKGNVIYCSSLSKSVAPGYRIGWIIGGKWSQKIVEAKLIRTVSTNTLAQEAVAHFLENGRFDLHLRRLRKELHTNYLRYLQAIQAYFPKNIRISQPKGGFVFWLEFDKKLDSLKLFKKALKYNISVAPGIMFSRQGDYRNYIRISFGVPWSDRVDNGLKKLGELVHEEENY